MERKGSMPNCDPPLSHFIDRFPPKESMKELVENRSRQGWNETVRLELRFFPTVGMESHLSNTHIVVAMP
jgi:hypothetical protein